MGVWSYYFTDLYILNVNKEKSLDTYDEIMEDWPLSFGNKDEQRVSNFRRIPIDFMSRLLRNF